MRVRYAWGLFAAENFKSDSNKMHRHPAAISINLAELQVKEAVPWGPDSCVAVIAQLIENQLSLSATLMSMFNMCTTPVIGYLRENSVGYAGVVGGCDFRVHVSESSRFQEPQLVDASLIMRAIDGGHHLSTRP